jgi:glycosyltransferase involved in cell wall biosynthesis
MVEDSITGFLVPPGDETALAERLRWILEHPREAQEMGRRARAFAKRFFSAQAYVHGYKQVFEAACLLLNEQEDHNAPPAI